MYTKFEFSSEPFLVPITFIIFLFLLLLIQGVFLSDIFETLITPSILKISSLCKAVMTNQTGQFDDLVRKSEIYEKRNSQIHSKFTQYFACDHVFRESTDLDCH